MDNTDIIDKENLSPTQLSFIRQLSIVEKTSSSALDVLRVVTLPSYPTSDMSDEELIECIRVFLNSRYPNT